MKNNLQRIVVDGDVHLDTVTVYSNRRISVDACPWMADRAAEIAPDGRMRLKGSTLIEPGARMVFTPYRIGSRGRRYRVLFATEHCEVLQSRKGLIVEKWRFLPSMNTADILSARRQEGAKINAYYQSRKEKTLW